MQLAPMGRDEDSAAMRVAAGSKRRLAVLTFLTEGWLFLCLTLLYRDNDPVDCSDRLIKG
jgi:hypothetical protein